MTDAAEIGQSALEVVADKPQFVEAERTTAHLTGAANLALGRSEIASQYFDLALSKGSTQDDNLSIYSLLGQAACAAAHEDWQLMLEMSRSAATLATEKRLAELTVEGKVAAMCSLIQLAKFEEARRVFADALQTQGITESLKRKAHREFLLAMADKGKSEETTAEEESLRNLIAEAPQPDDTWDKLKDRWALEKCVLLRDSRSVKQVVEARSQTLIDKGRKKDAAEVLSFGARLLADQGSMGEAYQLMSRAFGLSGTK
jgi:tetratricopeptide (TPR) repeat protein